MFYMLPRGNVIEMLPRFLEAGPERVSIKALMEVIHGRK
jgi:hypothetical protein